MPRRSKLDPYKDQILEWVRQGKDSRSIQKLLQERGLQVKAHKTVLDFINKAIAPTLSKISKRAETKLDSIESALDKVLGVLQEIESTTAEDWTPGMTFKLKTLGEWFDRFARLHGLYKPETQTNIAIAIGQSQAEATRELIESLPDALRASVLAFLRR
jgi:hypothetical protein